MAEHEKELYKNLYVDFDHLKHSVSFNYQVYKDNYLNDFMNQTEFTDTEFNLVQAELEVLAKQK